MPYELACGTVLRERYEIVALIGRGGMGAVYESHDRRLPGRRCAVKEIHLPADIGPALSGLTAQASDASSVFWSPAGITRLDREELLVGATLVGLKSSFGAMSRTSVAGMPKTTPVFSSSRLSTTRAW